MLCLGILRAPSPRCGLRLTFDDGPGAGLRRDNSDILGKAHRPRHVLRRSADLRAESQALVIRRCRKRSDHRETALDPRDTGDGGAPRGRGHDRSTTRVHGRLTGSRHAFSASRTLTRTATSDPGSRRRRLRYIVVDLDLDWRDSRSPRGADRPAAEARRAGHYHPDARSRAWHTTTHLNFLTVHRAGGARSYTSPPPSARVPARCVTRRRVTASVADRSRFAPHRRCWSCQACWFVRCSGSGRLHRGHVAGVPGLRRSFDFTAAGRATLWPVVPDRHGV